MSTSLVISLGDLSARLQMGPVAPAFLDQLHARYAAFFVPPDVFVQPTMTIDLELVAGPNASAREQQMQERPLAVRSITDRVSHHERLERLEIDRWDLGATLTRTDDDGFRGHAWCEQNPHSFDTLLRVIWSVLLPHAGGALLHACGVRSEGTGLVFPGVSERGKTTLARKVPDPDDVLSDELVIVRSPRPGQWLAYGTPFWGDFERGGVSRHGLPLGGIAFLEQSPALGVMPLSASTAALRLLACWLGFEGDPAAARRNLALAIRLVTEARVVEVHTRRETPLAAIVEVLQVPTSPGPALKATTVTTEAGVA
ncbi:MAG TPA: hypothetical protein VGF45_11370 [Polyangia bacterium]